MANITIAADELGAYEIPLTAGQPTTVTVTSRGTASAQSVEVIVHKSDAPVYVQAGPTAQARSAKAQVVPTLTWSTVSGLPSGRDAQLTLISDTAATVSVARV
jgi:hypothetical protein